MMFQKILLLLSCLYVVRAAVITPEVFEYESVEIVDEGTERKCLPAICTRFCIKKGYTGGSCISGHCKCDQQLSTNTPPAEHKSSNIELSNLNENDIDQSPEDKASCTSSICNQVCRKLGYSGGVCIRPNVCQCRTRTGQFADYFLDISELSHINEDSEDNIDQSPAERASCTSAICNEICRKLGYSGGVCISPNICQCNARMGRSASDDSDTSEIAIVRTLRSCAPAECNSFCIKMGYPRGVCIGTYCQCRMRSTIDMPSSSIITALESELGALDDTNMVRDCNLRWCEQNCRRLGFHGGACVNGHCKCDTLRSFAEVIQKSEEPENGDDIYIPEVQIV